MKKAVLVCALVAVFSAAAATQDPTILTSPPERFSTRVVVSGLEGPWEAKSTSCPKIFFG